MQPFRYTDSATREAARHFGFAEEKRWGCGFLGRAGHKIFSELSAPAYVRLQYLNQVAAWGVWDTRSPAPPTEWGSSPSGRLQCSRLDPPQLCCHRVGGLAPPGFCCMTHGVRIDLMFAVFFVVSPITRDVSDVVIERLMVDDVLNQRIENGGRGARHDTRCEDQHILVNSISCAKSPGTWTTHRTGMLADRMRCTTGEMRAE